MLRAMFPRPYCIHSEGALDKSIYLLQPAEPVEEGITDIEVTSEAVGIQMLSYMYDEEFAYLTTVLI